MKKLIPLLLLCFLFIGCSEEKVKLEIAINPELKVKLDELNKVTLVKHTGLYTYTCSYKVGDISMKGYSLYSGNVNQKSDYIKWKCSNEIAYLNCPDFSVSMIDNKVLVTLNTATKNDVLKSVVKNCAVEAIKLAPTKLIPRSDEIAKRDREKSNANSWN